MKSVIKNGYLLILLVANQVICMENNNSAYKNVFELDKPKPYDDFQFDLRQTGISDSCSVEEPLDSSKTDDIDKKTDSEINLDYIPVLSWSVENPDDSFDLYPNQPNSEHQNYLIKNGIYSLYPGNCEEFYYEITNEPINQQDSVLNRAVENNLDSWPKLGNSSAEAYELPENNLSAPSRSSSNNTNPNQKRKINGQWNIFKSSNEIDKSDSIKQRLIDHLGIGIVKMLHPTRDHNAATINFIEGFLLMNSSLNEKLRNLRGNKNDFDYLYLVSSINSLICDKHGNLIITKIDHTIAVQIAIYLKKHFSEEQYLKILDYLEKQNAPLFNKQAILENPKQLEDCHPINDNLLSKLNYSLSRESNKNALIVDPLTCTLFNIRHSNFNNQLYKLVTQCNQQNFTEATKTLDQIKNPLNKSEDNKLRLADNVYHSYKIKNEKKLDPQEQYKKAIKTKEFIKIHNLNENNLNQKTNGIISQVIENEGNIEKQIDSLITLNPDFLVDDKEAAVYEQLFDEFGISKDIKYDKNIWNEVGIPKNIDLDKNREIRRSINYLFASNQNLSDEKIKNCLGYFVEATKTSEEQSENYVKIGKALHKAYTSETADKTIISCGSFIKNYESSDLQKTHDEILKFGGFISDCISENNITSDSIYNLKLLDLANKINESGDFETALDLISTYNEVVNPKNIIHLKTEEQKQINKEIWHCLSATAETLFNKVLTEADLIHAKLITENAFLASSLNRFEEFSPEAQLGIKAAQFSYGLACGVCKWGYETSANTLILFQKTGSAFKEAISRDDFSIIRDKIKSIASKLGHDLGSKLYFACTVITNEELHNEAKTCDDPEQKQLMLEQYKKQQEEINKFMDETANKLKSMTAKDFGEALGKFAAHKYLPNPVIASTKPIIKFASKKLVSMGNKSIKSIFDEKVQDPNAIFVKGFVESIDQNSKEWISKKSIFNEGIASLEKKFSKEVLEEAKKRGNINGKSILRDPELLVKKIEKEANKILEKKSKGISGTLKDKFYNSVNKDNLDFIKNNRTPLDNETILKSKKFVKTKIPTVKGAIVYKKENKYYHRDTFHIGKAAHLEAYDIRGEHIGEADAITGELIPNTIDKTKKLHL